MDPGIFVLSRQDGDEKSRPLCVSRLEDSDVFFVLVAW